jgi:stage II sporulation protein D
VWQEGALVARAAEGTASLLAFNGRHYRGELLFLASDTGIVVVNRVRMDDYLRGVVPLEIGTRATADSAAVEAQAVTARSFAYVHLGAVSAARPYDITAGVSDQLYGGADIETPVSNAAIDATRGLVLKYGGRVVNAPYHSTCGGSTAAANEVWRTSGEPYLQRVSDQIPGTNRFYCDIAPRFRWTRTLDGATLRAALARYLGTYTATPGGFPGNPRDVMIDTRTPSGRVETLKIATDRGNYVLRGNDIRYVLRAPGGEILNSTYFSVETTPGRDGSVSKLTLRGTGYGHGVGMCQWGAIGRARAGEDFRSILRTYYPGTTVGPVE